MSATRTQRTGGEEVDLAAVRAALESGKGPAFWKSLEAVADTPAFRRFVGREYPAAAHLAAGPDRRGFFKVMAASFAMMGLAACDSAEDGRDYEVPYVRQPERILAGASLTYASTALVDGFANGVTVTTVNGRPIKIEGNDRHPWSLGGTDIFGQASVLGLYDPMRSQTVRYLNRISDWDTFRNRMLGHVAALKASNGKGFRLLTGAITSPSTIALIQATMKDLPEARWHMATGAGGSPLDDASEQLFGQRVDIMLHFDKAATVVSFEGDFLDAGPAQVGLARRYVEARRASAAKGQLLTLHSAASTPSLTSAKADFHVAVEPDTMAHLVDRVAAVAMGGAAPVGGASDPKLEAWVTRTGKALAAAKGESIVTAGATMPVAVIQAVHRLNAALGNVGRTVTYIEPVLPKADTLGSLVEAMAKGDVATLLMLDTNPVYEAPGSLDFAGALKMVGLKIQAGVAVDETAIRVDWHLPLAHPLESWGDARAIDGTASLIQPMIRPLFEGRTSAEILSLMFETQARGGLAIAKSYWQGSQQATDFEPNWRKALTDGFWPNTAAKTLTVVAKTGTATPVGPPLDVRPDTVAIVFRPDPTVRDGSYASNAWLQELPKPLTKVTWDNVVAVSPKLAEKLRLANGDIVAVVSGDAKVEGAAWILPGQAERTVTLTLGYGRNAPDMIYDGLGYDANPLRSKEQPWVLGGATVSKTGRKAKLATTQDHNTMEGHDLVRVSRVGEPPSRPDEDKRSIYGHVIKPEEQKPADYNEARAWGMVIDTDSCIGCNACAVACQSENNIAVVGKDQVALGRAMHWLRIDRYYSSAKSEGQGLDDPDTHFQPVPCMHCELAPCEVGCPVEATLHDHEGVNIMVYNRCIGTRACSGYCPYKVRRFNYLDYTGGMSPSIQLRNNPDVTVRARGVMEKCTYCIQRIAEARIDADKSGQPIADGAVQTACQTACPTRAITFGNLADPTSAVFAARKDPRNYDLLGELNVRPRTTYLAELAPATGKEG